MLGGCQDKPPQPAGVELPAGRSIATVYHVTSPSGSAACYRFPVSSAPVVTVLREQQQVDLVAVDEGMTTTDGEYWLHVYPRIGHRPACYINVRNLVPES